MKSFSLFETRCLAPASEWNSRVQRVTLLLLILTLVMNETECTEMYTKNLIGTMNIRYIKYHIIKGAVSTH
jgi:hypothetical protein